MVKIALRADAVLKTRGLRARTVQEAEALARRATRISETRSWERIMEDDQAERIRLDKTRGMDVRERERVPRV